MVRVWSEIRTAATDKVFWLIVLTAVIGLVGGSLWLVLLVAVLLTLWSCISEEKWFHLFRDKNELPALWGFWMMTLGQNCLFAGAAYLLGVGLRWWLGDDTALASLTATDWAPPSAFRER